MASKEDRLRYELWREFAPYLGIADRSNPGAAGDRVAREGGNPSTLILAGGLRAWFRGASARERSAGWRDAPDPLVTRCAGSPTLASNAAVQAPLSLNGR